MIIWRRISLQLLHVGAKTRIGEDPMSIGLNIPDVSRYRFCRQWIVSLLHKWNWQDVWVVPSSMFPTC